MGGIFCSREMTRDIPGGPESVHKRLSELLPGSRIVCLSQIHSDIIIHAEDVRTYDFPEADGVISRDPSVVLCIRTADCVPVLLWAEDPPVIAAVHAGWRGLAKRIVFKAVEIMRQCGSGEIHASMGPSIGPCCYAVGREVLEALGAEACRTQDGRISADLHHAAAIQAWEAGVGKDRIHRIKACTCCSNDSYFSYRREGEHAGRNISLIGGKSCSLPGLLAL